jgi:hypothetical protein
LDVSIWAATQLKEPLGIYARIPADSKFPQGFVQMTDRRPPSLQIRRNILTLQLDPKERYKIGLEAGALVWLGPDYLLRIDSPRHIYDPYPDDGSSSAILTSPDPQKYVQLEMLGPLTQVRVDHSISRRSTYTLLPRTELDPELEIRKQLPP